MRAASWAALSGWCAIVQPLDHLARCRMPLELRLEEDRHAVTRHLEAAAPRRQQRDRGVGKGLAEGGQVFPMERRAALIEQSRLGEEVRSAGNTADDRALAGEAAEPAGERNVTSTDEP